MSLLAAGTVTSGNAPLFVAVWLIFALTGYRMSVRHQLQRGVTPWNFPSIVWALICLAIGPIGILVEYFAGTTTRPAPTPPTRIGNNPSPVQRVDFPVAAPSPQMDIVRSNPAAALAPPKEPDGTIAKFGWYADVLRRHDYRYFDGKYWSDQVADAGVITTDPIK